MSIEYALRNDLDLPYLLSAFHTPTKWMDKISTAKLRSKTKYLVFCGGKVIIVGSKLESSSLQMRLFPFLCADIPNAVDIGN